jgi:fructoselysine-6-P-deglycase FrlB-like protein
LSHEIWSTGIWQDMLETPDALSETLRRRDGFDRVVETLTAPGVRRIVVTGNGSSYYAAKAMWLASLTGRPSPIAVIAVPGGMVAGGGFDWREGDVLLAVSTSGEFRDLVEAVVGGLSVPFAVVTAKPESTLGGSTDRRALIHIPEQRAVTHTHAYCVAALVTVALWAEVSDDDTLRAELAGAPDACTEAIVDVMEWAGARFPELRTPEFVAVFGSGCAWAGALEGALLVKEIARIPCEGAETREGATSVMTVLGERHLALSLPTADDPLCDEAEATIAVRGAQILRGPGGDRGGRRVAPITVFPAGLALAVELAQRAKHPVDNPAWIGTYYTTARVSAV